jgi:DNA-binding response OmpR family regulator
MIQKNLLQGQKVLIVDDEPDVLETLEELLNVGNVVKTSSFHNAKELLEKEYLDIAILDIMGVDGFKLLEIAIERGVIPVITTAHALSPHKTVKSYQKGADPYVPKEEIHNIKTYLNDILEAKETDRSF